MKKLAVWSLIILLCLGMIIAPAGATSTAPEGARIFKFGNAGALGEPAPEACQKITDLLNERLGGEIWFEFYPAEQLGNELTMLENLQLDLQQVVMTALDTLANYSPDLNILSMAFAFDSPEHVQSYLNSELAQSAKDALEAQGIHLVAYDFRKNPRVFFGNKAYHSPEDMQGMKYRIPNIPMFEKNARAMGAVPTVVAWSEYPFALMQGVVDGGECSKEALRGAGLTESCKFVSEVDYAYPLEQISFSTQAWESLTPEQQQIITDTINEVTVEFNASMLTRWEEDKKWLTEENGVEFVEVDMDAFRAAAVPLAAECEAEGFFDTPDLGDQTCGVTNS